MRVVELDGYALVEPPVVAAWREMSPQDARLFFQWFVRSIPGRIGHLEASLRRNALLDGALDWTPASLGPLGAAFGKVAERTSKPERTIARERQELPAWALPYLSDWTYTPRTMSLILDVSMYFGEVFRRQDDYLVWNLITKPKTEGILHQPAVGPLVKRMWMAPFGLVVGVACLATEGADVGRRLLELYDIWGEFLIPPGDRPNRVK